MSEITRTTTTHLDVPLPAGTEAYEEEWHHSPGGETHHRGFATKKFPVFDWPLTVWTGGIQFVQDDQPNGGVCVMRDVRIIGQAAPLLDSQARKLAQALVDAADYIAELEAQR
jgi:hypothetical protein